MNTTLVIALIELLLRVGPNVFIAMMKKLENETPTVEQIKELYVKKPEDYIND